MILIVIPWQDDGVETDGHTIEAAAKDIGVSVKTIRRYIAERRRATGRASDGVFEYRGRSVAFRRVPGIRNNEYRLWLDTDVVPPAPETAKDTMSIVLERLDVIDAKLSDITERLLQLERLR